MPAFPLRCPALIHRCAESFMQPMFMTIVAF